MEKTPRVLLIAEAANPDWVSVPLVGWSLARALSAVANVHLVTQIRNRDAVLRAGLIEGKDFTAIDSEVIAKPLWKAAQILRLGEGKGWTMVQALSTLAYPYFESLVWKTFSARLNAREFDLVHRITPLSPTIASPIARRCARIGIPFVLGPINGGVRWPTEFAAERRREREFLSYIRNVYKLLPGQTTMLDSCAAILVGSRSTEADIPVRFRDRCVYLPENAVDLNKFPRTRSSAGGPIRACFIGRMVPYKGPDMLIEAAAPLLRSGQLKLDMIGDGPLLPELRAMADRYGLADHIKFHGWINHSGIRDIAAGCRIFAFPSIREFGGGAVLEAMALGLVPIIVDYAGPSELVGDRMGFKIPLGSRDQIVTDFRLALLHAIDNPVELLVISAAARENVERYFTWQRKAEQVAQVYEWVLDRAKKPNFFANE